MIGRMVSYPYGNVRARALATRLFAPEELLDLAASESQDRALAEIERRLSLSDSQHSIDHLLQSDYLNFALVILPTLPEVAQHLFVTYLERQCLENLLVLCRAVLGGPKEIRLPDPLPMMPGHFPLPEPDGVGGLEDIAASLPEGPFRKILLDGSDGSAEHGLVRLENRLIQAYWSAVAAGVDRLPSVDREAASEILSRRADIDALRIVWRGIDSALDPDRILDLWPPLAGLLELGRLRHVLRSDRPEEGLRHLLKRAMSVNLEDGLWEMPLRRRLHRHLRRSLHGAPFGISVPLSALLLKEVEVMDLQGLLGGLRFELDQDAIEDFLAARKG